MCNSRKTRTLNESVPAFSAVFACVLFLGGFMAVVSTA